MNPSGIQSAGWHRAFSLSLLCGLFLLPLGCNGTGETRKFGPRDLERLGGEIMENLRGTDAAWMSPDADTGEKPRLAVVDIKNETDDPGLNKGPLLAFLETEIFQMGSFELIDREQRDAILDEVEEQQRRVFSNADAVRVGRLLGAEFLLWGSVGLTQAATTDGRLEKSYSLGLKVTSVEQGKIVYRDNASLPVRVVD